MLVSRQRLVLSHSCCSVRTENSALLLLTLPSQMAAQGSLSARVSHGRAVLPLTVLGTSGGPYELSLSVLITRFDGTVVTLTGQLNVSLRHCVDGEMYASQQQCIVCPKVMMFQQI